MDKFMVVCDFRKGTVMSDVYGVIVEEATAIVKSLPMAVWWDIDVYPLSAPGKPGAES